MIGSAIAHSVIQQLSISQLKNKLSLCYEYYIISYTECFKLPFSPERVAARIKHEENF